MRGGTTDQDPFSGLVAGQVDVLVRHRKQLEKIKTELEAASEESQTLNARQPALPSRPSTPPLPRPLDRIAPRTPPAPPAAPPAPPMRPSNTPMK
jgi:hypothetical protein